MGAQEARRHAGGASDTRRFRAADEHLPALGIILCRIDWPHDYARASARYFKEICPASKPDATGELIVQQRHIAAEHPRRLSNHAEAKLHTHNSARLRRRISACQHQPTWHRRRRLEPPRIGMTIADDHIHRDVAMPRHGIDTRIGFADARVGRAELMPTAGAAGQAQHAVPDGARAPLMAPTTISSPPAEAARRRHAAPIVFECLPRSRWVLRLLINWARAPRCDFAHDVAFSSAMIGMETDCRCIFTIRRCRIGVGT